MNDTVKTTCPYCGVGCGILVTRGADGSVSVAGDPEHPANLGRLCSKGSALAETISTEGRLLEPRIDGEPVSWDLALNTVANRFSKIIEAEGPDAVACFNVGVNTIVETIRQHELVSVDAIGKALQAGTNCGSCLPEIARILDYERSRQAA